MRFRPAGTEIRAATTLAAVAVSTTGTNERRPCPTRNPKSGRVSSVGIGRYRLPDKTSTNTPRYPKEWTTSMTHLASSASRLPITCYPPTSSAGRPQYAPNDARAARPWTAVAVGPPTSPPIDVVVESVEVRKAPLHPSPTGQTILGASFCRGCWIMPRHRYLSSPDDATAPDPPGTGRRRTNR